MSNTVMGLDKVGVERVVNRLNDLLSSYQIFYQNLRGYHWNIIGKDFFELHLKFEEFYNNAQIKIDEIAERVLTLEATPLHSFNQYTKHAKISAHENVTDGSEAVNQIKIQLEQLVIQQRETLEIAEDNKDIATSDLMTQYISEQEKTIWMLKSFLS
ncbi:MAG: DNA starvation/stationary phase protection protein [Bacteroidetes bacterium]|nr:DNA starvation/stationary phase protection protein [Bacteroidota bacterium]